MRAFNFVCMIKPVEDAERVSLAEASLACKLKQLCRIVRIYCNEGDEKDKKN